MIVVLILERLYCIFPEFSGAWMESQQTRHRGKREEEGDVSLKPNWMATCKALTILNSVWRPGPIC